MPCSLQKYVYDTHTFVIKIVSSPWTKRLRRSLWLLAIVSLQTQAQKNKIEDSNIQTVPSDLRRAVSEALAVERRFLLGANDAYNCTSEEDDISNTPCPPSKYRSASGECNNVRHRPWGRRGDVFIRLLPPNYADGVSQPMAHPRLPEPALAIQAVAQLAQPAEHDYVTSMLAAWGQFVMDDLIATANGNKATNGVRAEWDTVISLCRNIHGITIPKGKMNGRRPVL
ncbi:jg17471 [Pararge aegeria aegeria]|uniref:Jg17471 protein n=1 Tax=Pararge aegeria aegeria TaxID=348720 RepID=A0A8S4RQ85_9NEOP|nr:jg17471 [Pararge aegeria aegeria]